jgi:hypothetical protein
MWQAAARISLLHIQYRVFLADEFLVHGHKAGPT